MGEYSFGISHTKPTRNIARVMRKIAERHSAYFIEATLPGTGYQRWFSGPNRGAPFDQAMKDAVIDDLIKAGIDPVTGRDLRP